MKRGTLLCLLVLLGVLAWSPASPAQAADCNHTLQSKIDATADGGTALLDACTYRSEGLVSGKNITIKGQAGTEIKGSDVFTSWNKNNNGTWNSTTATPNWADDDTTCLSGGKCQRRHQVFMDGVELSQVASGATPGNNEFKINNSNKVVVGQNPNQHLMEVTMRPHWVEVAYGASNGVTIDGVKMLHASAPRGEGGFWNHSVGESVVVKNSDISYAHNTCVATSSPSPNSILNNHIHHCGSMGVSQYDGDLSVTGNEIDHNNTQGSDPDWEAGGVKAFQLNNMHLDNNTVHDNAAYGLWCDSNCEAGTISGNTVHHNDNGGIFQEVNQINGAGVSIDNNQIYENGWKSANPAKSGAGLGISNSLNVEASNNIVAWNPAGIRVHNAARSDGTAFSNIDILNNYIASSDYETIGGDDTFSRAGQAYQWVDFVASYVEPQGPNSVYYPSPENSSYGRFRCNGNWLAQLATFNQTACAEPDWAYMTQSAMQTTFSGRGVPTTPETH